MLELVAAAEGRLAVAGVDSARFDAEELAAHVLGVRRPALPIAAPMTGGQAADYEALVSRREARVPLQHLVGSTGFRRIELLVGAGVFVPRPETESVVQWALDALRASGVPQPLVADLCSGSGTIALALADELPAGAVVHAVERDPAAFAWLERNIAHCARSGVNPVHAHLGDAGDALPDLDARLDLVASNPPYVAEHERGQVEPEVVDHDPEIALFAGSDGLDVVRVVERTGWRLLRPGGRLVIEHSDRQGTTAPALLQAQGWNEVADHRDLAGRDRFVTARRP